jgi:membrane-associated protease RseP (regulator of RpoE activity)
MHLFLKTKPRYKTTLLISARCALLLALSAVITTRAAEPVVPPKQQQSSEAAQQQLEAAQERLEKAAREVAELSSRLTIERTPDALVFLGHNPNRAALGIGIGGNSDKDDGDGVPVLSVSPGGPAAGAGIKAGDVITEINGKPLKGEKGGNSREKLITEMSKLSPGDEVTLRYRRDDKMSIAKLKADKLLRHELPRTIQLRRRIETDDLPGFEQDLDRDMFFMKGFGAWRMGSFGEMELAPLTPKLGQYFGADKGLLIVRAPQDKDYKLEDGDVLLDIDGRVPENPSHAFRILGSYQPGEKVTINVLRQRKKIGVGIVLPKQTRMEMHGPLQPHPPRAPVEPPAPPASPSST